MSQMSGENGEMTTKMVVSDTRRILIQVVVGIFCCLMIYFIPIGIYFFYMARIHAKGYVVDIENNTFEFPGGAFEANDVSGLFNIKKYFQRHTVPLSSIQQISTKYDFGFLFDVLPPFWKALLAPGNLMIVSGTFGSLRLRFFSRDKRDLLFATISQANGMGSPIINR